MGKLFAGDESLLLGWSAYPVPTGGILILEYFASSTALAEMKLSTIAFGMSKQQARDLARAIDQMAEAIEAKERAN